MQNNSLHISKSGFTLIELLVVISIIGLLSSIVLASLKAAKDKATNAKSYSDLHQISLALELYASDRTSGSLYPTNAGTVPGTLNILTGNPPPTPPIYIKALPTPGSGVDYWYASANSNGYVLIAPVAPFPTVTYCKFVFGQEPTGWWNSLSPCAG